MPKKQTTRRTKPSPKPTKKPRSPSTRTKPAKDLVAKLAAEAESDAQAQLEHKLRSEAEDAKARRRGEESRRKIATREADEARRALDVALRVQKHDLGEVNIKPRERTSGVHEATAVLLYSDLHPDEVVTPETVSGLNEFNLEVARARNAKLCRAVPWWLETIRSHEGRAGFKIRDFVLAMLGDMISNTIHPELMESNSLLPAEAVIEVSGYAVEVIDTLLADTELETITIVCAHGNHDRMTIRIRHQTKAGNSLAWILYHTLAERYRNEPRVRFQIARGGLEYSTVYGHSVRWTHGDDIRYHGGVGGLTIPMRKAIDAWNQSRHAHLTCCGHWHQFIDHRDFVVNGSMIGYTAYAQAIKARFEPAAQGFFVLNKQRGKQFASPILLQDGAW